MTVTVRLDTSGYAVYIYVLNVLLFNISRFYLQIELVNLFTPTVTGLYRIAQT
jgi:hypothetical protein